MSAAEDGSRRLLLTSREVARFVRDGFLRFPALVPAELNAAVRDGIAAGRVLRSGGWRNDGDLAVRPLARTVWADDDPLRAVFALPRVDAMVRSLLGPEPLVDSHVLHSVPARTTDAGPWHCDAEMELRAEPDLLVMYFPADTPREAGGTILVPGSHLRSVRCFAPSRYDNYVGQEPTVCPAGTVVLAHPAIWHASQPNRTDAARVMYKIRLCPGRDARSCWNTDDLGHPEVRATLVDVQPWQRGDFYPIVVQRVRWWRQMLGDEGFDVGNWLWRFEHRPGAAPRRVGRGGAA